MKIRTPELTDELSAILIPLTDLVADAGLDGLQITDVICEEQEYDAHDFSRLFFRGVVFRGCRFSGCSFQGTEFSDVIFENCDFSNSHFENCYMTRCRIAGSKFTGAVMEKASLTHVVIANSLFPYFSCDVSTWKYCRIEKSDFHGSSIYQAKVSFWEPVSVDFTETIFLGTLLKGVDLSSCTLDRASFSDNFRELKGAVLNRDQAAELARVFGIKLAD